MFNFWSKLSDQNKGIALIGIGALLLLHTFGFVQKGLNLIIILSALFMIGLGLSKLGVLQKIMAYFHKR